MFNCEITFFTPPVFHVFTSSVSAVFQLTTPRSANVVRPGSCHLAHSQYRLRPGSCHSAPQTLTELRAYMTQRHQARPSSPGPSSRPWPGSDLRRPSVTDRGHSPSSLPYSVSPLTPQHSSKYCTIFGNKDTTTGSFTINIPKILPYCCTIFRPKGSSKMFDKLSLKCFIVSFLDLQKQIANQL